MAGRRSGSVRRVRFWEERGGYGDAYQTAQAFASAARREGVRLRQSTSVTEIITGSGGVTGVRLADGTSYRLAQ